MTTEQDRFLTDEQLKSSDSEFKNMQKAWYEKTYGVQTQEATTEANKRIAELESDNKIYAECNAELKEANDKLSDTLILRNNKLTELMHSNNDLREAFQNILDGNYPSPRTDRGKQCAHGKYYWEDCTECIDDYIQTVLQATPAESLQAHDDLTIEKCAKVCIDIQPDYVDNSVYHECANAIRAFKEVK